ncbi:MAG: hypothetical protein WCJ71_00480 [Candidatus Omnitrophota bacterium]
MENRSDRPIKGFGFIGLILGLVLLCFLYYLMQKNQATTLPVDQETKKQLSAQGIDTTSYDATIHSVKAAYTKALNQKQ